MRRHYIEERIEEGEHDQQDFKFAITDARKIARSLSAFANTRGGRLLIGVADDGRIAGARPDEELHMLDTASRLYTRPQVEVATRVWRVAGRVVLEATVAPGDRRPYRAPDEHGAWTAFVRLRDNNVAANSLQVKAWRQRQWAEAKVIALAPEHDALVSLLRQGPATPRQFARAAQITDSDAQRVLVDMLAMGVVRCLPSAEPRAALFALAGDDPDEPAARAMANPRRPARP